MEVPSNLNNNLPQNSSKPFTFKNWFNSVKVLFLILIIIAAIAIGLGVGLNQHKKQPQTLPIPAHIRGKISIKDIDINGPDSELGAIITPNNSVFPTYGPYANYGDAYWSSQQNCWVESVPTYQDFDWTSRDLTNLGYYLIALKKNFTIKLITMEHNKITGTFNLPFKYQLLGPGLSNNVNSSGNIVLLNKFSIIN